MEILDAQLHCWLLDRPSRPWDPEYRSATKARALNILLQTGVPMSPETLLLEMAAAGVDGGVLTPQGVYGTSNALELESAANYPRKFTVVGWVDHLAPDVDALIARDVERGMRGIRLLRLDAEKLGRGDYEPVLTACAAHNLAVALTLPHPIPAALIETIKRHAGINFLIDHLGVGHAPPAYGLAPEDPWEWLPSVLALATNDNVYLKLTGAPALSHEPYPFKDIWDPVRRIIDAFGVGHVLWGSDITRTGTLSTYAEATHYLRELDGLSASELAALYGASLRVALGWDSDDYLVRIRSR